MGRDCVGLNRNVNVQRFLDAASTQAAHDYVPPGSEKDVLAHTKLLGPGESDTITFNGPFIPGKYVYLCSFPGHYAQGTKGIMTVKLFRDSQQNHFRKNFKTHEILEPTSCL